MKAFTDKRRLFWLGGILVLTLGILAAFIILPMTKPAGSGGPDVHVPKMENVPPEDAPKMKLEPQ